MLIDRHRHLLMPGRFGNKKLSYWRDKHKNTTCARSIISLQQVHIHIPLQKKNPDFIGAFAIVTRPRPRLLYAGRVVPAAGVVPGFNH